MSIHSDQARDSQTLKQPVTLETTEILKNEDDAIEETIYSNDTAAADKVVGRLSIDSKSLDVKDDIATSPSSQTTDSPKLSSISEMSLNTASTSPRKSHTITSPSEISRMSLETIKLCTKTPPNSKATSSMDLSEFFLNPLPSRLVLCVGLCTLDIVHICEKIPNARQLLNADYWQRGGNASNNCTVLRNLGAECEFLGIMSKLPAFRFLIDDCHERGIIIENCPLVDMYPPFSSILSCRITSTFTLIHTNLGFPILRFQHFKENIQLNKYSWIHFEARNPEETKPMINMIRRFNTDASSQDVKPIMISLELAKSNKNLLPLAIRANLLFIGREFAMHLGWSTSKDTVYNLRQLLSIMQLREEKEPDEMDICFRCPHIVCPWGSEGCSVLTSSYEYYHIAAIETDHIVDAKGSGDTFVATIIYAMNNLDMQLKAAVTLGYQVAVFKMQHRGLDCIKDYTIIDHS